MWGHMIKCWARKSGEILQATAAVSWVPFYRLDGEDLVMDFKGHRLWRGYKTGGVSTPCWWAELSLVRDSCGQNRTLWLRCGQVSQGWIQQAGRLGSHLNNLDPMGQQACPTHLGHPRLDDKYSWRDIWNASMSSLPSNDALSSENLRQFHISCCLLALKRLSETRLFNLRAWSLPMTLSGLIIALDHECCEAIMVVSPLSRRNLNLLFILWITARLLKLFQREKVLPLISSCNMDRKYFCWIKFNEVWSCLLYQLTLLVLTKTVKMLLLLTQKWLKIIE